MCWQAPLLLLEAETITGARDPISAGWERSRALTPLPVHHTPLCRTFLTPGVRSLWPVFLYSTIFFFLSFQILNTDFYAFNSLFFFLVARAVGFWFCFMCFPIMILTSIPMKQSRTAALKNKNKNRRHGNQRGLANQQPRPLES